jgi:hypothetical protein
VEAKEFLEPCKAITTLQIARDVRTNSAVEISTALDNLPEDIKEICKELDSDEMKELDAAHMNDFSIRIPSTLLDLNIEEEMASVRTFQDIVQRQQMAREQLIFLLLKSRCQFGSSDAARDYYEMDEIAEKLKKRKQLLSDALELEGLDVSQIVDNAKNKKKKQKDDEEEKLPPISWYKPEGDGNLVESDKLG